MQSSGFTPVTHLLGGKCSPLRQPFVFSVGNLYLHQILVSSLLVVFFFEPLMTTHQCIMLVWRWSLVHSVVLDKSCCSVSWCAQVCMSCGRQGATRVTPPIRWWTWLPEFLPWSHHGHESTEFRGMFYICFTSACQQVNWLITWPSC